jgi:uncharacterized LabA/DUF88 family protein
MPKCVVLVDNSNVFIEGQKYSANSKGVTALTPAGRLPRDPSWRINFGGLLRYLAAGREIHAAILVGSRPPRNDEMWKMAENHFNVFLHDRDMNNKEKAVDTELVAQGTEIICDAPEPMVLVIASGDRDFIPLVKLAQRRKWQVEMCAFESAFGKYGEMATSVDRVRPLEADFASIGHCDFTWPHP